MRSRPLDVFHCPLDGINLIEASAGTGKTWNLCGLFLRLLLERRLEVSQLLVVTFTNAATAELRERIRSRIAETLARLQGHGPVSADPFVENLLDALRARQGLTDADMAQQLDQALQGFDEASIFTIHGFCQRALADTSFTSGLPMALELLADDRELHLHVTQDFWRRHVAGDALEPALAAYLVQRGDTPQTWSRLLKRRLAKPLSHLIWPPGLDTAAAFNGDALAAAHADARALWMRERDAIVGGVLKALPRLHGGTYKETSVAQSASDWSQLLAHADSLASAKGLGKLELLGQSRLQSKAKKNQSPPTHAFFELADQVLALRAAGDEALALARLRLLRSLLDEGSLALRRAKRERRVVAFDDLLHNVHERLTGSTGPALAAALRARFPAALIDEFQDTDPLQFAIFQAIYGDGSAPLFLVGDPKQAIYSFRGADLHTYLQARQQAGSVYTLAENQRSTEALLGGLNALFEVNPRAFMLPGLDYQPVRCGARPRPPLRDRSAARAPLQLWTLPPAEDGAPLRKAAARSAAAAACAGEIARLLNAAQCGEVMLDDRALAAGDMAVLVRSHAQGSQMRRALAAFGIGSVELSQASVHDSPDAEDLERVLAAVLEPSRERLLRAALATELMGLDAAGIESLSADEPRLLATITRFTAYRQLWMERGIGVTLRQWMQREAVNERLLARADGERRLTNLLHLGELLQAASEIHVAPEALLRWMQAQRGEGRADEATQLRLESDRNLVQIVTIHKSKGLEYPFVFCPFLWDGHPGGPRGRDEGLEYHDANGLPVLDFRSDADVAAVQAQLAQERAAEQLRLIYVALTRAVHRCHLVVGPYTSGPQASDAEAGRALLNWLVAGADVTPADWLAGRRTPAEILAAWARLAEGRTPQMDLASLPSAPVARAAPPADPARTLSALAPPQQMPSAWWIGSFSSLTRGARHERAAADHELQLSAPDEAAAATSVESPVVDAEDILHFPRGPLAGECLHAVFEHADFSEPSSWPLAIETALRTRPQPTADGATQRLLPAMLQRMLRDVLDTPLPWGVRLAGLPGHRRLVELEFNLPVTRLGARTLAAALDALGVPAPPLAFGSLSGYLRGFIDLVFEDGGRYYLVDWKSNHLGHAVTDYAEAPVARAMVAHGYQLQVLLYAVALHRYLRQRLPDYRYETHFGGAMLLFVRGVRPGWTLPGGGPAGVWAWRPPEDVIERLSALFDARQEAA